jgi:non-ribosomal peptide synthetase component F
VNLLLSVQQTPGMAADDVVLAITTLSFDIAVSEVLLPLTVGARVVLATREVAADGPRLRALIEEAGITFIDATPATYRLLLAAGWAGGAHLRVICTGEAMPRDLGDELCARAREVWNGYGPTETTVWSTFWRVRAPVARVLIGTPVANTRAYVLDARGQPVPAGGRGELYIGGLGVALGYLHRPELTAERFLADPYADEPGARMYRTGDVVRVTADGALECLGRNDHQVKLRGFRIELGEIESRLATHPAVGACAVIVREDVPGDRRLVAYVAAAADGATAPPDAELRAHLKAALPDYMIPQAFVRLATLPLTPSGKVDRNALPAPQAGDAVREGAFVAPRTAAERLVAELWAEALRAGRLGAHDDFFQLGGHSLLASQVLGRLRRDHGVALPYRRIFEASTVERFAELVERELASGGAAAGDGAAAAPAPIPHDPARTRAPLTLLQQRLWRLEELDPATAPTHVHSAAWWLRGAVDAAAAEGALADFVARHDQMRTRFVVEDGAPVQAIEATAQLPLARVDLTGVPADERPAAIARYAAEQEDVPFDLAAAPLMRAALVTFGPGEHLLYTVRHGLVWDGWSFDLFITEFCAYYEARVLGRAATLAPLSISFGDYAAWQAGHLASAEVERQVAWWRTHLGESAPALELPTDRPRPPQPTYRGEHLSLTLTRAEVDRLTARGREQGATLYMVLLAAYGAVLHRYSGQREFVVGTPVRARTRPELEGLVGAFVNTVPLRLRIDPGAPFADLLAQVRDLTLDAFGNQDVPFELLGDRVPTVRTLFSLQDVRARPLQAPGLEVEQLHVPMRAAANDLTMWAVEFADRLIAVFNFSTDLFDRATADRFLAHLHTLLRAVDADPRTPVARLPLLSAEERRAALGAGPAAPARPAAATVAAVVGAGAVHPGAPAVRGTTAGGADVSYAALLARADAVRAAVAGRGGAARVAVLAGDLAARAAATLGVLAAGAAVLLLDPRDPAAHNGALLGAAAVDVAVVERSVAAALGTAAVPCVLLDELAPGASPLAAAAPPGDATAFLLSDVDADGRPSVVPLPHGALDALVADAAARLGADASTRLVALHSPAAPVGPVELLTALTVGGALVAPPADADEDGELLAECLEDADATVAAAPAETWAEVVAAGWAGDRRLTAVVTGEADGVLAAALARGSGGCSRSTATPRPAAGPRRPRCRVPRGRVPRRRVPRGRVPRGRRPRAASGRRRWEARPPPRRGTRLPGRSRTIVRWPARGCSCSTTPGRSRRRGCRGGCTWAGRWSTRWRGCVAPSTAAASWTTRSPRRTGRCARARARAAPPTVASGSWRPSPGCCAAAAGRSRSPRSTRCSPAIRGWPTRRWPSAATTAASCGWWPSWCRAARTPRPSCGDGCATRCRRRRCRSASPRWRPCHARPTGPSRGSGCRRSRRAWPRAASCRRAPRRSSRWRRSGRRCWRRRGWGSATTSSTWAGARCSASSSSTAWRATAACA